MVLDFPEIVILTERDKSNRNNKKLMLFRPCEMTHLRFNSNVQYSMLGNII